MDYVSTKEFRKVSNSHKILLESRGYEVHRQLCLDNYLVRNARWKTYWHASKHGVGDVFVKINYGYNVGTNTLYGKKESLLPPYFASYCTQLPGIKYATVIESWEQDSDFGVVYKYETFTNKPIGSLLYDVEHHGQLLQFLKVWSEIPPPDWWNDEFVLNNFALQTYPIPGDTKSAPFGFDLGDNLGVDQNGKIFIYDFEFIQWASPGLQDAYFNYFILGTWRNYFKLLSRKSFVYMMFQRVVSDGNSGNIVHGYRIYRERHLRNNCWHNKTVTYAVLARALQYLASSFASKAQDV
ncbi:MAG: hypothetical protein WBM41_02225 [Arenicellales bacterium]